MKQKEEKNLFDFELEKKVLGTLLNNPEKYNSVNDIIEIDTFFNPEYKSLFSKYIELQKDDFSIEKYLSGFGDETRQKVFEVMFESTYNLTTSCKILKELWIFRNIKNGCENLLTEIEKPEADAFELLSRLNEINYSISENLIQGNLAHISKFAVPVFDEIMANQDPDYKIKSIPTQNCIINNSLYKNGLVNKRLYGIAARPGEGKTSYLVDFTSHNADKHRILFYSLEMTAEEICEMILANKAEIYTSKLLGKSKYLINKDEMTNIGNTLTKFKNYNIWLNDSSTWHIDKLAIDIRNNVKKYGIEVVLIDYLQLINGSGSGRQTRESQITYVSNQLKNIAKVCDIPIFLSIQLNRDADNKRPQLSNLRESGGIEQALDVCIAIHNDKEKEKDEMVKRQNQKLGMQDVNLILLKNRRGSTIQEQVVFMKPHSKFHSNIEEPEVEGGIF